MGTDQGGHANPRGLNRLEVWLFAAIAGLGLLGFMSTLSARDVHGLTDRAESDAAAYAEQMLEELTKQPFPVRAAGGALSGLEPGYTGVFSVTPIAGSAPPNRLARITVTVQWGGAETPRRAVTRETIRAE